MLKEEILKVLRESEGYVSGQELCESFGVSRTAVWKAVTKLKEEGYEIDSVSNRGYRLKTLPDVVTEAEIDCIHYVVIGVGINVNEKAFPEELPQAASLFQAAGKPLLRAELIALCMEYFEKYYEEFERTEDLRGLKAAYEALLVNRGRQVRVLEPGNEHTGTALGINDRGELLVELSGGRIEEVYAGEVSVRGVYGYV